MTKTDINTYRAAEKRWWDACGIQPKEHFIPVPKHGITVRVLEVGEGLPTLFVHGSPSGASIWAPLAARLKNTRCLLLDRPGCGLSESIDYTHAVPGDLKTLAVDTQQAVLDALHIDQTVLIGNSHGGAWVLWFAASQPDRVERIVCEGPPGYVKGLKMGFMSLLRFPLMPHFMAKMKVTPKSLRTNFRQMGHEASLREGRFSDTWFKWCTSLFTDTDTWRNEMGGQSPALLRGRGLVELTYTQAFLNQLIQPILAIWGEKDNFVSVEAGQRFVESLPNAILKVFPHSGHLPWLDDIDTHASLINAFLSQSHLSSVAGFSRSNVPNQG